MAGPVFLSFDKKVAYYLQWKSVFKSMIVPALFYLIWDIWFTKQGIWSFNEKYITGYHLFNLPIEEVLFFFVVPFCCLFIYVCIKTYFPDIRHRKLTDMMMKLTGIVLTIMALTHLQQDYTFYTFMLNTLFILLLYIFRKKYFTSLNVTVFVLAYVVMLIPFLIVNGLLTSIPVVLYNDAENLGIRIGTIPVEDIFYGMLLIWGNVLGYEYFNSRGVLSDNK